MKENNIRPSESRRLLGNGKIHKGRGVWNYHGTGAGPVMVKDKILQRLIALKDSRNSKSGFDADNPLAVGACEVDVLFGVVAGRWSNDRHQVRCFQKLLIRPNANSACRGDAGRDEQAGSDEKEYADRFHIAHLTESAAKCSRVAGLQP